MNKEKEFSIQIELLLKENKQLKEQLNSEKNANKLLRDSEEILLALFNAIPDIIFEIDNEGKYIQIAPTSPNLLYKPAEDLLGKKLHEVFNVPLADKFLDAITKTLKTKETSLIQYSLDIGKKQVWFEARITPKTENTVLFIGHEITDKVLALRGLEESRNRYHQIFETASVSIWEEDFTELKFALDNLKAQGIRDFSGYFEENPDFVRQAIKMVKIKDVNKETLKLYKAANKKELLEGLHLTLVDDSLSSFKEELVAIAEGHEVFEAEEITQNLKGERVDILFKMAIPLADESYDNILISMMDITDIKRIREELMSSQEHIQLINKILRHDISNCFNIIKSALRLYRRDQQQYLIDEIEKHMNKGINLIRSMKQLEQVFNNSEVNTPVDLGGFINHVLDNYSNMNFDVNITPVFICANDSLISVLDNVISNAMKHGGADKIAISNTVDAGKVILKIADNGIGVPDNIKDKIFDEHFKYGKTGNTGLGLYICSRIMHHYGGSIRVEDNLPNGTTMVLTFVETISNKLETNSK